MKKLKTPLWVEIVYFLLIFVTPVVITCLELFQSKSTMFKWSFTSIGLILMVLIILKKYVFKNNIKRMEDKLVLLEHDFSIDNGNKEKIFVIWKQYKLILNALDLLSTLLSSILAWLFITALSTGLIAFKGAMSLICLTVIVAITFKLLSYSFMRYKHEK